MGDKWETSGRQVGDRQVGNKGKSSENRRPEVRPNIWYLWETNGRHMEDTW